MKSDTADWAPQEQNDRQALIAELQKLVDEIIGYASTSGESFFEFEKQARHYVARLGCLLCAIFLASRHEALDLRKWEKKLKRRPHSKPARRSLRTSFGEVAYWRHYFARKGGGTYPLDIELRLHVDRFSPWVISTITRLATRMSFKASQTLCLLFFGWAPSTRTIGELVLGLGRKAAPFMEEPIAPILERDEVLVIEADGKATPTATQSELEKRRGKRQPCKEGCRCGCQRHRGRQGRARRGSRPRRKRGDKSKNGKSVTLAAVYTLRRGADGKLHGPYNKRIWGSYAPRKQVLEWAKREAVRRGIDPATATNVQIVVDGEKCLAQRLQEHFPKATIAIDVRHVEEKLWTLGNMFFGEGSDELAEWVENQREFLYAGEIKTLIERLKRKRGEIGSRGPGTKSKRDQIDKVVGYLNARIEMMNYGDLIEKDLVIATGVIEGAARHVVGERMDCSGMRWIRGRAEALLHLRCIEINGEWDRFIAWVNDQIDNEQRTALRTIQIRHQQPIPLPEAA